MQQTFRKIIISCVKHSTKQTKKCKSFNLHTHNNTSIKKKNANTKPHVYENLTNKKQHKQS